MNQNARSLYAIGKISKAFGVNGEIVVLPMTDSPERFKKLKQVYLGKSSDGAERFTIKHVRVEPRGVRLKFAECPDRTSVERIIGLLMFVDEQHRVVPKKGTHFIHDVVGMTVMDENNNTLGTVKDVLRLPAHDVYVIEQNGTEWMVPAVKEFVRSIDVPLKRMTVRLIEGLGN